ncbi:hypothetical protein E3J74_03390 [Candidatus Bathyarchaeota archaeon]|nr:MAG: hypothetical protein E3J74_03390 [Candidatus Bathyarchaeota archaeon]
MASIREVPSKVRRFERIGAHTHIKGLGLDENSNAVKIKDGMVGQEKAREAAGLIVKMIQEACMLLITFTRSISVLLPRVSYEVC